MFFFSKNQNILFSLGGRRVFHLCHLKTTLKIIKLNTFEGEYEKNIIKKEVDATKKEHIKKIDNIKNDKIKKSLLELSKIFKPK